MYRLKTVICCVILIAAAHVSHVAVVDAVAAVPDCAPTWTPKVSNVRNCFLGFDKVVADFYWLVFMQYVGDTKAREIDHYCDSDKFLDLIIGLDTHFIKPYFFGLFLISGEENNPKKCAELIQKGICDNPESWYLLYLAGLNQYLYEHNELRAAAYYRQAAKFQLAPKWLEHLAGVLESKAPSVVKQICVWENVYETSMDDGIKMHAQKELIKLWCKVYQSSAPNLRERAKKQLDRLGADLKRYNSP
jgi:hypothetical protein